MAAIAVIPARFGSRRFPGKPLANLLGKPMIQHTYESVKRCALVNDVFVATDDLRIQSAVEGFGGNCVMTGLCETGTDRVVEAVGKLNTEPPEIVINVQGDEPKVDPNHLDGLVEVMREDPSAHMGTLATLIRSKTEAENSNSVKVVVDTNSNALYFSRALIPGSKDGMYSPSIEYLRHIGVYAFRHKFLATFPSLPVSALEQAEQLEQLRVLESGYRIKVLTVGEGFPGVDTPEDMVRLTELLDQTSPE